MVGEGTRLRLLILHCDYFRYEVVERTRISEEVDEEEMNGKIDKSVLVAFVCAERSDESDTLKIAKKSVEAITDIARQVKEKDIALHSFAHLSDDLSSPHVAKRIIDDIKLQLNSKNYNVLKTPFGWRDRFELCVKSHLVSKVSRKIMTK
ncbi:MAG: threonyl-tRNA synthetase editing domain-containing protein [Nitrososphaerales archaeon]